MMLGFVVTPSTIPWRIHFLISRSSAESMNIFTIFPPLDFSAAYVPSRQILSFLRRTKNVQASLLGINDDEAGPGIYLKSIVKLAQVRRRRDLPVRNAG